MSTQGHGMIEDPDTVEACYLPKCLSGDNHQGNCHNYVFDYVYVYRVPNWNYSVCYNVCFWTFFLVPEFVGFQTVVILDPYFMTFDAVGVFGLAFHLLFRSWSTYCEGLISTEILGGISCWIFRCCLVNSNYLTTRINSSSRCLVSLW